MSDIRFDDDRLHPELVSSHVRIDDQTLNGTFADRRVWLAPTLEPHSTLTVVTQYALPIATSLLFLQTSQCFDAGGTPVPCQ